ncbi:MAG: pilus assembly protein [Acidimicrobiia bacterium]|nr:pilus assembly protein [Acidimicrobiia bacterium]
MTHGDVLPSVGSGARVRRRRPTSGRVAATTGDGGQSTVEVALLLPVVVLLALAIVQVSVIAHQRLVVTHATREAARVAAVTPGGHVDATSVGERHRLDPARLSVDTSGPDGAGFVLVDVRYVIATDVPMIGAMLPDVTVRSTSSMMVEW